MFNHTKGAFHNTWALGNRSSCGATVETQPTQTACPSQSPNHTANGSYRDSQDEACSPGCRHNRCRRNTHEEDRMQAQRQRQVCRQLGNGRLDRQRTRDGDIEGPRVDLVTKVHTILRQMRCIGRGSRLHRLHVSAPSRK